MRWLLEGEDVGLHPLDTIPSVDEGGHDLKPATVWQKLRRKSGLPSNSATLADNSLPRVARATRIGAALAYHIAAGIPGGSEALVRGEVVGSLQRVSGIASETVHLGGGGTW